jgi:hypothetical protein
MITPDDVKELRKELYDDKNDMHIEYCYPCKEMFHCLDTIDKLWAVAKAAKLFNGRFHAWAGSEAKSPLDEALAALEEK